MQGKSIDVKVGDRVDSWHYTYRGRKPLFTKIYNVKSINITEDPEGGNYVTVRLHPNESATPKIDLTIDTDLFNVHKETGEIICAVLPNLRRYFDKGRRVLTLQK